MEKDALQAVIELTDSVSRRIEETSMNRANVVEMASTYRRLVRGTKSETDRQNFEDLLQVCTQWTFLPSTSTSSCCDYLVILTDLSNMLIVQPHRRVIQSGRVAAADVALMDGEHSLDHPVRHSATVDNDDR